MILSTFCYIRGCPSDIPDLELDGTGLLVGLNVDVDGEMGVDVAHLILESAGDTDDQVVDDGPDSAESSNGLTSSMVNLDSNGVLLWAAEADRKVGEVLDQLSCIIETSVSACQCIRTQTLNSKSLRVYVLLRAE